MIHLLLKKENWLRGIGAARKLIPGIPYFWSGFTFRILGPDIEYVDVATCWGGRRYVVQCGEGPYTTHHLRRDYYLLLIFIIGLILLI